ncbi:MAG: NAD(+)/NADH kinase [Planctomycetes bacterium]|nr:NAD(+)/NADH kinase [Planctomycetota bacterium]
MKRIILSGNTGKPAVAAAVAELLPWLRERAEVVALDLALDRELEHVEADLAVILGGDGAILSVARRLGRNQISAIGVNLGKFGFLAEVSPEQFRERFDDILAGRYRLSSRMRLACTLCRDGQAIAEHTALNDVVLSRGALSRLVAIGLVVDGVRATTYNGDGVIVSTPTGSTAHSLSAGGPVIEPHVDAFVVTPICPHTLTNRPVVMPASCRIELSVEATPADVGLTVDGQVYQEVARGDRVVLRRAASDFRLIDLGLRTYYDTLREKLHWSGSALHDRGRD